MRFILCLVLAACAAFEVPAFAADAVFSPAPSTSPSGSAQATPAAATVAPAQPTTQNVAIAAPSWLEQALGFLTSGPGLVILAGILIRLEAFLQAKTKINLAKATGIAHSLFNTLFDMGLIKNGAFKAAEEAFFSNFNTQFFNAYGHTPDSDAQDNAHAQFAQLFTAHTGDELTPAPAQKVS